MMKKRWISFLLAVCILTALIPAGAVPVRADYIGPEPVETAGNFQYMLDENGNATIMAYTGTSDVVTIPKTIDGHPVTAIGEWAFSPGSPLHDGNYNCETIKTVQIDAELTAVGAYAFSGCTGLETVNLPETITSMGYGVFANCSALKSAKCPSGMTKIPISTFSGCTGLESAVIPETIESIGADAFDVYDYIKEQDGALHQITYGGTSEMWEELLEKNTDWGNDVLEMLTYDDDGNLKEDGNITFQNKPKPESPKPDPEPKPDPKPAPTPEEPAAEETAPNVLGTVGMIATAGVGAAAIGYAGYQVGTELYLIKLLPEGAAIPANAGELALLVWNDAGKPAPAAVLPADAPETQQAMTWAVEQGLLSAEEKPEDAVSRAEVIRTWKKAQKRSD